MLERIMRNDVKVILELNCDCITIDIQMMLVLIDRVVSNVI